MMFGLSRNNPRVAEFMGLLSFLFGERFWKLHSLADFWQATQWLDKQRQKGREDKATLTFLTHMHKIVRASTDQYVDAVKAVNDVVGGIYSSPELSAQSFPHLNEGESALDHLKVVAYDINKQLDDMQRGSKQDFLDNWSQITDSVGGYGKFLTNLVEKLGNFERMCVSLPGMGQVTIDPVTQANLQHMYEINVRNIRLLTLIHTVRRAWSKGESSLGFFKAEQEMGALLKAMLVEYLVEADPVRVDQKKAAAKAKKRPYGRYRFWRPAENLRQMWGVEYVGSKRSPKPGRPFVDVSRIAQTEPMTVDIQRVEWSFKEVFNNCLSATTIMNVTGSTFTAKSLDRHEGASRPVIGLGAEIVNKPVGRKNVPFVRVTIADEGVGMTPEVFATVPKWAYSTRRAKFAAAYQGDKGRNAADQAMEIGGKGIGLRFSQNIMRDHGGDLTVNSQLDRGTIVTMEIPVGGVESLS
ncbi:MAG: hypothetical protein GC159_10210 [Phycisphaera sp.]|nr:hypothetical protein [Phycisphaera sp.]